MATATTATTANTNIITETNVDNKCCHTTANRDEVFRLCSSGQMSDT